MFAWSLPVLAEICPTLLNGEFIKLMHETACRVHAGMDSSPPRKVHASMDPTNSYNAGTFMGKPNPQLSNFETS
ncbi:hypothetical protein KSB_06140 [Ktedonobacter robiniae]|uniref:Uncharacterized protein n=1 Tax=Ktedonobacter robiniae TaxID=2778365 RepID=A0ABQ3UHE7_9CHLR|nr:hypothetical protein KSB_06140 [Ktedonobacter robiniae]